MAGKSQKIMFLTEYLLALERSLFFSLKVTDIQSERKSGG
jgi:hypothetical protein